MTETTSRTSRFGVIAAAMLLVATLVPQGIAIGQEVPEARSIDSLCPPGEVPPANFEDTAGNVHERSIACLVMWGIAQGVSETEYDPSGTVRRSQMATFIAQLIEIFAVLPDDPPHAFDDVAPGSVHAHRINQLAAAGVISGFADGTYGPGRAVSRAHMATFINQALEFITGTLLTTEASFFTDVAGNAHEGNINGLASEGIVAGFGDGTYRPGVNVRRDQMGSFIARGGAFLTDEFLSGIFFVFLTGYAELDDSGDDVVYAQGDLDGSGFVILLTNAENGQICYEGFDIVADGSFTGNHIHVGRMDENGPVVVPFSNPDDETGELSECVDVDPELIADIEDDPGGFYVNVHTDEYPPGAVRGNLDVHQTFTYLSWAFETDGEGNFGVGEEDAEGLAWAQFDLDAGQVCTYATTDATPLFTGYHIHEGTMDENGPVVVGFANPGVTGEVSDCVDAEPDLLVDILVNPQDYYYNIHNALHPPGAVRGQAEALPLVVHMSAEEETAGGEPGATGTAYVQATLGFDEDSVLVTVCHYTVTDATGPFTGYHVHEGPPGEDGPIVVGLEEPDDDTGEVSECLTIDVATGFGILFDLEGHYLNVHTEDYPAGAVRGQLIDGWVLPPPAS